MKILTISDVVVDLVQSPRIKDRFGAVELVLSCGDLPIEYLEYVVTMLGKPLFHVLGNHVEREVLRDDGTSRSSVEGCIDVDRRTVYWRGLLIGGLEGSMRYCEGPQQYTEREMSARIALMGPRLWLNKVRYGRAMDILITHAPPRGIHDGTDLCHRGFECLLRFMDQYKPRYLIHGHTHLYRLDAQRVTQYGQTTVVNTYGYQIIDIDLPSAGKVLSSETAG